MDCSYQSVSFEWPAQVDVPWRLLGRATGRRPTTVLERISCLDFRRRHRDQEKPEKYKEVPSLPSSRPLFPILIIDSKFIQLHQHFSLDISSNNSHCPSLLIPLRKDQQPKQPAKMQFSIIAISFLASFAMAGPAKRGGGGGDSGSGSGSGSGGSGSTTAYDPCTSLLDSQPLCCATDVLGLVSLDCAVGKQYKHPRAPLLLSLRTPVDG